ncbi:MAG: oxidoreductase [SAR202 cluster bacterium Io17-Chloro-G3]|nr:MAG: oxidoreductase [SAR202 cluster bacterium Io17-Chloro-G3]
MRRLENKVAIITGGAGGIGKAAGKLFVEEGAHVVLVDLQEEGLQDAVRSIGDENVSYVVADTTQPDQVLRFVNEAVQRHGGVDILIANAGIEGEINSIIETPVEMFDKVMSVNVRGVWLGLKYVMPLMRERGGGSIVITSSTAGVRGSAGMSPYSTSKHAVIGLMRSAAMEGASMGIRVNTVNPAPIQTRMMRSIEEQWVSGGRKGFSTVEEARETVAGGNPLRRYGEPEEVGRLMMFLASDESSYCNGGVYMVDGGNTAGRI